MFSTDNNKKKSTGSKLMVTGLLAGLLALASTPASATLVTSRAALGATDYIDWGQLGADTGNLDPLGAASGPVSSNSGVAATFSTTASTVYRFDQGNSFSGNFDAGDKLLATFFESDPIAIIFTSGLSRIGAQIQSIDFGAFSGAIAVYDALDTLLESHSVGGVSNADGDNSAIFIGVSRATADIYRVVFNVTGPSNLDFAINRLALSSAATAVPAPASLPLLALGLAGLVGLRRRATR